MGFQTRSVQSADTVKNPCWGHMGVHLSHTYLVYVRSGMYILYNVTVYIYIYIWMIYFWFTFGCNLNTCRKYFRHWNNSGLFPCCHSALCAGQWEIKIYFHCLTENNEVHLSGFSYVMRETFTLDRSLTPPKCAMMKSVGTRKATHFVTRMLEKYKSTVWQEAFGMN